MLCFIKQGLLLHRCRELLFSCWKSEVKPNDVEMAQNFMYTLLMAVLNDIEVFG